MRFCGTHAGKKTRPLTPIRTLHNEVTQRANLDFHFDDLLDDLPTSHGPVVRRNFARPPVSKRSVLGGLHHEYGLVREAASRPIYSFAASMWLGDPPGVSPAATRCPRLTPIARSRSWFLDAPP